MTARHAATHGGHHFCFTHFLFIILAQAAETGAGGARTRRHASGDSDLQPGDVLLIKPKAQRDDVLKYILTKCHFLERMVSEYTDPNSPRRAVTGFILELCNHIRLKADVQHSSDFLWSFISQMEKWNSFQPILRQQTLLQVHNIAKPKPGSEFFRNFLLSSLWELHFRSFPFHSPHNSRETQLVCFVGFIQTSPRGSASTLAPTTHAGWALCRAAPSLRSRTRSARKKRSGGRRLAGAPIRGVPEVGCRAAALQAEASSTWSASLVRSTARARPRHRSAAAR